LRNFWPSVGPKHKLKAMTDYVIDASSILAFVFDEPGAGMVIDVARTNRLFVSSVNMAEVLAKLSDKGIGRDDARMFVAPLELEEISFKSDHADVSAILRPLTRRDNISLGDRCCLALALTTRSPVLTAERTWRAVAEKVGVEIVMTR